MSSIDQSAHMEAPRARRPKRPTIAAMIKAAKAAGLEITAIETNADGVKLVCGAVAQPALDLPEDEETAIDRHMAEQMGVDRFGKRIRR
jgi:hypothetical protein